MARPGEQEISSGETEQLLREYRFTGDRAIRNRVVEGHLGLAGFHVRRFARTGSVSVDDLRQTALMAVVHAADRFEPGHGATFATFAARTIEGELKRHLRDRSWAVRPPRRAQEIYLNVSRCIEELSHELHRSPTVTEIGDRLGISSDQVLEGMEAGSARVADHLEAPGRHGEDVGTDGRLGRDDPRFGATESHLDLGTAIGGLDERARQVLHMRFVEERSQPEIAEHIGISQSYVSRIIRGSLAHLRDDLAEPVFDEQEVPDPDGSQTAP